MNHQNISRRDSEEHFRMLMAGVKDYAIILLDNRGIVISWNSGAERIKGYSAEEIVGKHFSKFYPSEDVRNGKPDRWLKIAETEGRFEDEGWRLRKDGSRFYANVVISALRDDSGKLRGFAKVTRDISERKEAERQLNDVKHRLSLALEAGEVGVWDLDLVNSKIWRSGKLDKILGITSQPSDLHLESLLSFVAPNDRESLKKVFEKALETGHFNLDCKIVRADKVERWISSKGETVYDSHHKPIRLVGTVVDITDRMEREDNERMLAVMQERADFVATLTHDMKNPLIGANRLLELLVAGNCGLLTDKQAELLKRLKESNHRLLNLIHNIIDIYRFERDANTLVLGDTDVRALVESVVHQIEPIAKLRRITVTTQMPAQVDEARVDSNAFSRVIQNLLDNAVKFAPDNGHVCVRLFGNRNELVLEIEDNGPGIEQHEREDLFRRFSQGSVGRRRTGGTGLGLYLCKQIMELHGGQIDILNSPEKPGTTFQLRMPLQSFEEHSPAA